MMSRSVGMRMSIIMIFCKIVAFIVAVIVAVDDGDTDIVVSNALSVVLLLFTFITILFYREVCAPFL
jgi:hypothetical protein